MPEENNKSKTNQKQNERIIILENDRKWIIEKLNGIDKMVANEIPHQLIVLDNKIDDKVDKLKDRLTLSLLVGFLAMLIMQVILKFF